MSRTHRDERLLGLAVAVVVGAFAAALATGAAAWLNGQPWFANGSNLIQWVSGPFTFAGIAMLVYGYWTRRCAVPFCPRRGEHPVAGTLKRVCVHHHTLPGHELVHALHHDLHLLAGRLGWGESHGRR